MEEKIIASCENERKIELERLRSTQSPNYPKLQDFGKIDTNGKNAAKWEKSCVWQQVCRRLQDAILRASLVLNITCTPVACGE
jgi:hypothetical protein